jgi:formylglycine-generating enzyme required for sulfatase activity
MSRTEVTNAQYARGRRNAGTVAQGDLPATDLSWKDAKSYCVAAGGRLPTESEWEYAARAGGTSSRYDVLGDIGWYANNSDDHVHPVGQKTPNAFGLFDMLGNVYEWVADRYYDTYGDSDDESLVEPLAGNASAVARGGAFVSQAKELRASSRFGLPPDAEEPIVGFRCVADQ